MRQNIADFIAALILVYTICIVGWVVLVPLCVVLVVPVVRETRSGLRLGLRRVVVDFRVPGAAVARLGRRRVHAVRT